MIENRGKWSKKLVLWIVLPLLLLCCWFQSVSAESLLTSNIQPGMNHSLAVQSDKTLFAWGSNDYGQLGNATTTSRTSPMIVPGIANVTNAVVGEFHSMALKDDGTVWAWGYNGEGQLGDDSNINRSIPVQVSGLTDVIAIAAGARYSLALKADGTVWTWGANNEGQLGDGNNINRKLPMQVNGLANVASITAGPNYAYVIKADGTLWAWGYNGHGQLGDNSTINRTTPVQAVGITDVKNVAAGNYAVIAVLNDGTVWAWGYNGFGQFGDTSNDRLQPAQVTGLSGANMAAVGENFTLLLKADGTLWSWGRNEYGQLGDRNVFSRNTPAQIKTNVSFISAKSLVAAAITTDGAAWAWGNNDRGQLGRGTNVTRTIPGQVKYTASVLSGTVTNVGGTAISGATLKIISEDGVQTTTSDTFGFYEFTDLAADFYDVTAQATAYKAASVLKLDVAANETVTQGFVLGLPSSTATAPKIYAGLNHSLQVKADKTVAAWGYNGYGQLGDGTTINRTTPLTISELTDAIAAASGEQHSLALKADGTVWAWGYNGSGQLGDRSNSNSNAPVQVMGLTNVINAAAGAYYSLALKDDGTVWSWGNNDQGQLGDGTYTSRSLPVQVKGLTNVASITAGPNYALAVKTDGTLWTWGYNGHGQLGDNSTINRTTPVQAVGITGVKNVAAGNYAVIAVLNDGTVWAWGYNGFGQFGDTSNDRWLPAQVTGLNGASMAAVGENFTLLLKTDGTLWSWGRNEYGQLGDRGESRNTPAQIKTNVSFISAKSLVAAAITTDGLAWAWGNNDQGQLGRGTTVRRTIPGQIKYTASTLSGTVTNSGGTAISDAALTLISEDGIETATSDVFGYYEFTNLAADLYSVTAQAITYHAESELGIILNSGSNNTQSFILPSIVQSPVANNISVASGSNFSLYIDDNETVWAWGNNAYGQLGNNTFNNRNSPTHILGLQSVKSIAAGDRHSVALTSDGTVWTWGNNDYGQLGDSTTTTRNTPTQIAGFPTPITAVSAGDNYTLALDTNGNVWSWGYNGEGELGNGTTINSNTPVQIPTNTLTHVVAISAGKISAAALLNDGTVWTWGYNGYGQLGDGTNQNRNVPIQVNQLTGVSKIAVSERHMLALKQEGTVWAWGDNSLGQLGDRTSTSHLTPVIVPGFTNVKDITAGRYHSTALKDDSSIWSWGYNDNGQLGDGTTIRSHYPIKQQALAHITKIGSQGNNHSIAVQDNGTLWAWGYNGDGQLGNGTNTASLIPVAFVIQSGVLSGVITTKLDGTPIGGATITLNSTLTGNLTANSAADGTYRFNNLPSGSYSLSIEASGYERFSDSNLSVANAQTITLNTKLTLTYVPVVLSDDAYLANLIVSGLVISPDFSRDVKNYSAVVGQEITSVTVTALTSHSSATIVVHGSQAASGSLSDAIPLNAGNNVISVIVTAEDGTTIQTYTITVIRTVALSTNADLSGLTISQGTPSPPFASGTLSYTASVGNAISSITITPTVMDATAQVAIDGSLTTSGAASIPIELSIGSNSISIQVTAQDGSTHKTYTLVVNRALPNHKLKSLTLSEGTLEFSSQITNYDVRVASTTTAITVTAAAYEPSDKITVKVNGIEVPSDSLAVSLNEGANIIQIEIIPQGTILPEIIYTVKVIRAYSSNSIHHLIDFNEDGRVSISDIIQIIQKSPEQKKHYDLNFDGVFDNLDLFLMLEQINRI